MMRQTVRKDFQLLPGCSTRSPHEGNRRSSLKRAPRLLRYLGGNCKSCPDCGLEIDSDVDVSCACSECLLKIKDMLENQKNNQDGKCCIKALKIENTAVTGDEAGPLKIIIMQEGENNEIIQQLTSALNCALNLAKTSADKSGAAKTSTRESVQHNPRNIRRCSFARDDNNRDQTWPDEPGCELC